MIPVESVNRISLPLDCALVDKFESDGSEISTGKLDRLEDPDTNVLLMVIGFRKLHALLYQVGPPLATLKLAVTLAGPVMVRLCGLVVPDRAPLKPVN